jgi:hypothetical protein
MRNETEASSQSHSPLITYRQEQIFWLQITVGHLVTVAIAHGVKKNFADISSFLFVVITLLHNAIEKFTTHHLLSNKIVEYSLVENVIKPNNVFVLQFRKDGDFILQSGFVFLGQLGFGHNLDSKGPTSLFVGSLFDNGESTFAELQSIKHRQRKLFKGGIHVRRHEDPKTLHKVYEGGENMPQGSLKSHQENDYGTFAQLTAFPSL